MDEDEVAQINSEMRYMTLELMKIASKKRKPFSHVASEFVQNVYRLKHAIKAGSRKKAPKGARNEKKGVGSGPAVKKDLGGRRR